MSTKLKRSEIQISNREKNHLERVNENNWRARSRNSERHYEL